MNITYSKSFKIKRKEVCVPSDYLYIELCDVTNINQLVRYIISSFGDSFPLSGRIKDFYDDLIEYKTLLSESKVKLFEYKKQSIVTNIYSELLLENIHNNDLNEVLSLTNCTGGLELFLTPENEKVDFSEFLSLNKFKDNHYMINEFFKRKINSVLAFVYDTSIDIVLPISCLPMCQNAVDRYVNSQFMPTVTE